MAIETCFEDGFREIVKTITSLEELPVLAAIWGKPNSGKTYLIKKLEAYFKSIGMPAVGYGGGPGSHTFERIRDSPDLAQMIHLFHCAWVRNNHENPVYIAAFEHEDPNILAERLLNRKLNLNVAIYNPRLSRGFKPEGVYDMLISNPDSHEKQKSALS